MFNFIRGILSDKKPMTAVIEAHGVGYELSIPLSTYSQLPAIGTEVKLLTHLCVREDAWLLFGFSAEDERALFKLVITVSGIGPKIGLTILSGIGIEHFKQAIVEGDVGTLTSISGIGRKTAERMIVELREKVILKKDMPAGVSSVPFEQNDTRSQDALVALTSLGYKRQQAQDAIRKVLTTGDRSSLDVEGLIRHALKYI